MKYFGFMKLTGSVILLLKQLGMKHDDESMHSKKHYCDGLMSASDGDERLEEWSKCNKLDLKFWFKHFGSNCEAIKVYNQGMKLFQNEA